VNLVLEGCFHKADPVPICAHVEEVGFQKGVKILGLRVVHALYDLDQDVDAVLIFRQILKPCSFYFGQRGLLLPARVHSLDQILQDVGSPRVGGHLDKMAHVFDEANAVRAIE